MRGGDERSGELFSYVDLEARVRRDHPLRGIRAIVNEALAVLEREFAVVFADGAAFDPLGASFDGAAGVRPSVPLVCRDRRRRRGVGPFGVLEEPRSAAGRRHRGELSAVLAQPTVTRKTSSMSCAR
jgi:PAS domain-containing protein